MPRFEVDRENTSIKKQIVTRSHYKIEVVDFLSKTADRFLTQTIFDTNVATVHQLVSKITYQILLTKTFPENWESKAPSVGTLLAYLKTTA